MEASEIKQLNRTPLFLGLHHLLFIPMTSISTQNLQHNSSGFYSSAAFCRIVGLVCIVGFVIDILAIGFPPAFDNLEWRINILQQVSDRSIILLFGFALTLYSSLHNRPWRKYLVATCLILSHSCLWFFRWDLLSHSMAWSSLGHSHRRRRTSLS